MTSQKNGMSALGLQRVLGLGSYKTAWPILHKLRQAMVRPGRDRMQGVVEIDETYWGATESGGATGLLIYSKALIVVAAEQDGKGIGRIRMARIMETRLTNAAMESVNGILQLAKRMARGFRNFHYFRITAYLKVGGLQLDIPHI